MRSTINRYISIVSLSLLVIFSVLLSSGTFNDVHFSSTIIIVVLFILSFLLEIFKRRSFGTKDKFLKNRNSFLITAYIHLTLMLFFSFELRVYAAAIIILDAVTLALYAILHSATGSARNYFLLMGVSFASLLLLNPSISNFESIIDLGEISGYIGLFGAFVVLGLSIELFAALKKFAVKVEELERARSSNMFFTASFGLVSHNIRTPLSHIKNQFGILKLLHSHDTHKFLLSFDEKAASIEQSMASMDEMIASLINNYKDQIDFISNKDKTLLTWWNQMKQRFSKASFGTLHLLPGSIRNDSELFVLTLALQAFIDNAEKHANSSVHIFSNEEFIFIQDQGKGFSDEIIHKIGKDIIKSKVGSGLGLFLVYQLLAANKWHMTVSNTKTGGLVTITPV